MLEDFEVFILLSYLLGISTILSYFINTLSYNLNDGNSKIITNEQVDDISNTTLLQSLVKGSKYLFKDLDENEELLLIVDNTPSSIFLLILIDNLFPLNSATVYCYKNNDDTQYLQNLCELLGYNYVKDNSYYLFNNHIHLCGSTIKKMCEDETFTYCFTNINSNDFMDLYHKLIYLNMTHINMNNLISNNEDNVNIYNLLFDTKYHDIEDLLLNYGFIINNNYEYNNIHYSNDYKYLNWRYNLRENYNKLYLSYKNK